MKEQHVGSVPAIDQSLSILSGCMPLAAAISCGFKGQQKSDGFMEQFLDFLIYLFKEGFCYLSLYKLC